MSEIKIEDSLSKEIHKAAYNIMHQEIIDAYLFLRENNHTISDAILEFIKETALIKLNKMYNIH